MASDGKLISAKQIKLDKANQTIVIVLAVCSFVIVFSLIASKSLISKYSYQSRVLKAQHASEDQIIQDQQAVNSLSSSYKTFIDQTTNAIGGSSTGTGAQDGSNSKIINDALPPIYDYPALITSVQNIISVPGLKVNSISGTDTSSTTPAPGTAVTPTPQAAGGTPIAMPFTFTVEGSYTAVQSVFANLQKSVRPIQVVSVNMTGSDSDLTATVNAQTYYLPAVGLSVTTETIQ